MGQQKILLGVGATKSATSWLYSYLFKHPECYLRRVKEIHYFDAKHYSNGPHWIRSLKKRRRKIKSRLLDISTDRGEYFSNQQILKDIKDAITLLQTKAWDYDHYTAYLKKGMSGECVLADITPAYSLLPSDSLSEIAHRIPYSYFLYQMRDPVARLWSHARMIASRTARSDEDIATVANKILENVITDDESVRPIRIRGNYKEAAKKLKMAIPGHRLHLCFTEEILSDEGIRELCKFIEIPYIKPNISSKIHKGVKIDMKEDIAERAADYLRPQYEFVRDEFGYLPKAWLQL